ncbi:hypothetical protein [Methanothrix soehngenii]|mgnify:CR=1|jgi:hypothetical protein
MKKGKSRTHNARTDLLRRDATNARRRARKQVTYDKRTYDTPRGEES